MLVYGSFSLSILVSLFCPFNVFSLHKKNHWKEGVVQWHFAKEQSKLLCNGEACRVEEVKGKISKALKCLILSRDILLSKPCKLMALPVQGTQRRWNENGNVTKKGQRGKSDESRHVRWVNERESLIAAKETKDSFM